MKPRLWPILLTALILLFPLAILQVHIDYYKQAENLESNLVLMPGEVAGDLVLAGFKGVAADLLWLNMENYWHSGQHYKMLPLLQSVAWLEPNYILVWTLGGWHMTYNIYADVKTDQEKEYWYQQGIKFLKMGITYNPDKYDIYFELGWTYYNKRKDYPNSTKYLEKAIIFPHPDYVDDVLAHSYEKNGQKDKAVEQWKKLLKTGFKEIAERMIHELKIKGKATP